MGLFKQHSTAEQAKSIAHFLPGGRVFARAFDQTSNLGKYLFGLASELYRIEQRMNLIASEHDITTTTELIDEWESAVGIPDTCLSGTGTLEERRRDILVKLAKLNVTTIDDFLAVAAEYGVTCTVTPGSVHGVFPFVFPIHFYASAKAARFTIEIEFTTALSTFPLTFPIPFGDGSIGVVKCLFNRIKPANVDIWYLN